MQEKIVPDLFHKMDCSSDRGSDETPTLSATTWVVRPDPDLADLIPSFMQNRKNELVDLEIAVSRSDFDAVRRLAHTWKGICRPYGFVHLETLSRSLEDAGEREALSDVQAVVSEMKDYIANVRIVYDS